MPRLIALFAGIFALFAGSSALAKVPNATVLACMQRELAELGITAEQAKTDPRLWQGKSIEIEGVPYTLEPRGTGIWNLCEQHHAALAAGALARAIPPVTQESSAAAAPAPQAHEPASLATDQSVDVAAEPAVTATASASTLEPVAEAITAGWEWFISQWFVRYVLFPLACIAGYLLFMTLFALHLSRIYKGLFAGALDMLTEDGQRRLPIYILLPIFLLFALPAAIGGLINRSRYEVAYGRWLDDSEFFTEPGRRKWVTESARADDMTEDLPVDETERHDANGEYWRPEPANELGELSSPYPPEDPHTINRTVGAG